MKTDKYKTAVKFLVNGNDIFAFFPRESYDDFHTNLFTAYSHVGQHSSCLVQYADESRPATAEERKPLIKELESIGYNLEILN